MIELVQVTRELVDQIVFGMENQDSTFYLDTAESRVLPEQELEEAADDSRYIQVPEWRSVDGYNLMEQFVAALHNPIYRERLRSILASGRGVFRQFKDTVRERREIERAWFTFKERHMRSIVTDWLNGLREQAGLERLSDTPETLTDELVDIDFTFRDAGSGEHPNLQELDREAFSELYPDLSEEIIALYYRDQREGVPRMDAKESRIRVAETLGGEFAGFLWATVSNAGEQHVSFVRQLYVVPEFRGLGLARALLHWLFETAHAEKIDIVLLDLQGDALALVPHLTDYGMRASRTTLSLAVEPWYRSEHLG